MLRPAVPLAVVLAALGAAPAGAGTYTVHNCSLPSGQTVAADGWRFTLLSPLTGNLTCRPMPDGSRPLLAGWLMRGAQHQNDEGVELTYSAPPDTEIAGYTIWRTVDVHPAASYNYLYHAMEGVRDGAHVVDRCEGSSGCDGLGGRLERSGLSGVRQLWLTLRCRVSSGVCPPATPANVAQLEIARADMTLRDLSVPVLTTPPSGTLLDSSRTLTGVQWVSLAAADAGAGVYQALFEVDGRVVDAQTLDDDGGRCHPPFTAVVPCPPHASRTVGFDTSRVPDGEHLLRVLVTDASGTNAAPYGPIRIRTMNAPCSAKATAGTDLRMALRPRRRTVRYRRKVLVRGRLTTRAGQPVGGAAVCVGERADAANARLAARASVVTDPRGRFSYRVPAGPSRRIRFAHRAASGAVVARSVRLRVRAPVRLRASRRSLRNGQRLLLRGTLPGRPRPRGGVLVELQAWRTGRWQTFATTEAGPRGRFSRGYRFTRTVGRQTYRLRARVPHQPAYPYAAGASRAIAVTVSG
jgi:hypothetical protein